MSKESQIECKNFFKNLDEESLIKEYNLKWLNLINKFEKDKLRIKS